ncbi:hypothetical protein Tco_0765949 [Tanacetum coccineum]
MNMALVLMVKPFKLNYSTPTNNKQRISSNPGNRQIAQLSMNMSQDRQMQMVGGNGGNQLRQYARQNVRNQNGYNVVQNVRNQVVQNAVQNPSVQNVGNHNGLIIVQGIGNKNPNRNGNVVAAQAKGNANGNNEAGIQLQAEEFDLIAAAADLDKIEKVNVNCIVMANLQQALTSVQQNNSNVISEVSSMEQSGGTVDQHPATVEETHAYFESLYNNLAIKVEKVNTVNRKLRETNADLTTELARYKIRKSVLKLVKKNMTNLKEVAKFVRDFKSLAKEADESLTKHKALELEIERLLRAVVS